jgi:hypothetical protein
MSLLIASKNKNGDFELFRITDTIGNSKYIIKEKHYGSLNYFYMQAKDLSIQGLNSEGIKFVVSMVGDNMLFTNSEEKIRRRTLDKAVRQKTLRAFINVITNEKFIGNILVSKGKKCYSINISSKQDIQKLGDILTDDVKEVLKYSNEYLVKVENISNKNIYIMTRYSYMDNLNLLNRNNVFYEFSTRRRRVKEIYRGKYTNKDFMYRLKYDNRTHSNINLAFKNQIVNIENSDINLYNKFEKTSDIIGIIDSKILYLPLKSSVNTTIFKSSITNQFKLDILREK